MIAWWWVVVAAAWGFCVGFLFLWHTLTKPMGRLIGFEDGLNPKELADRIILLRRRTSILS